MSDAECVVITLSGLPSSYDSIATTIRLRIPPVTCVELHNLLLSEEFVISSRHASLVAESENKALYSKSRSPLSSYNYRYSAP